jgi:hypothetical protein
MQTPSIVRFLAVGLLGLLAFGAILLASVFIFVSLAFTGPVDLPWQRVTATMQLEAVVEGNTVHVVGITDLPDGALIDYYYWRDDAINEGPVGVVEVEDGSFSFEDDISELRPGRWSIEASFSTLWGSQQPEHITDLFGSEGEHLAGPQVYVDSPGDAKQIVVSTDVEVP